MASSVTTTAHGVRVVTQIIPLDTPAPPSPSKECKTEASVPYMTRMFLKGEPTGLGTVQVFTGLVMMALGVILLAGGLNGEVPLTLGLSFVICGSVTLAAQKGTHPRLIKCTFSLNVIGTLLAVSGICYFSYALTVSPDFGDCGESGRYWSCKGMIWNLKSLTLGLKIIMLVVSVLEVCVCITLVVFSCKACRQPSVTTMEQSVDSTYRSSHEALLKVGENMDHPPAYEP